MEEPIPYITLAMTRDHMDGIPVFSCPQGYRVRTFEPGDERHWARVETAVGEFPDEEAALRYFEQKYGPYPRELGSRCFLLETEEGRVIGTATAWHDVFEGEERGRVSWVGIVPEYQGNKLAKPLVAAVMDRLARDERKAFLTTQTTSYRAINLYLAFGFMPYLQQESCREGWALMERVLQRPILLAG